MDDLFWDLPYSEKCRIVGLPTPEQDAEDARIEALEWRMNNPEEAAQWDADEAARQADAAAWNAQVAARKFQAQLDAAAGILVQEDAKSPFN